MPHWQLACESISVKNEHPLDGVVSNDLVGIANAIFVHG